ncbi:MAG: UDP-N-acetylmuramate dehydrogenase [Bacteroidota bacterium]
MISVEEIGTFFKGRVAIGELLRNYTSFRIGGPADFYLEPRDKEDLLHIVQYFQTNNFPFVVIGNGSNLLVSDEGYRGAVINLESGLKTVTIDPAAGGASVYAEAGVKLAKFVDVCIQRGLGGVEMLAGIPGTLGGAIVMNAGAYGGEISDCLRTVEIIRDAAFVILPKEECGFAYRGSELTHDIVVSASFQLPRKDRNELLRVRRELLLRRNETQPVNFPNAGSIFKNPPKMYAGKLIEEAGLKGKRIGGAEISERHANFIVNRGTAKASDVVALIRLARDAVKEKFGIVLELEVKLLGFPDDVFREGA